MHKKLSVGVDVAITIGVAASVAVVVAGFVIMCQKHKKTKAIRSELQSSPVAHSPLPSFPLSSISAPLKHEDIQYKPVMVSPSLTCYSDSELDAVGTEHPTPESGSRTNYFQPLPARSTETLNVIHELPAREEESRTR